MNIIKSPQSGYFVVLPDTLIGQGETKHSACSNAMKTLEADYAKLNEICGYSEKRLITDGICGEGCK